MDNLYEFDLQESLIAQQPASPRDHAKLLVFDRRTGQISDDYFYNLCKYLPTDTLVVANNSKVAHCRYLFHDAKTEIFAVESLNDRTVRALVRPGRKFKMDTSLVLGDGIVASVTAIDSEGIRTITFNTTLDDPRLQAASHVPLPPYIKQDDSLAQEYQTIYAKKQGSLAAPTAGLHFTKALKDKVTVDFGWSEVTLEVGLGTFASLQQENFIRGTLHSETYHVGSNEYECIKKAQHVTCVGTTSTRTLESVFKNNVQPQLVGDTDIFIVPGYTFNRVNALITNFHLPGTSLLLLVEAFLGSRIYLEQIYEHAIAHKYRFYSFGDAMLIL